MFRGLVIYMLGHGTPNMKDNTCLNNVLTNLYFININYNTFNGGTSYMEVKMFSTNIQK
jgi:hypothetical protein